MGTTLHAHIEVKKNGQWLHYAAPSVNRNYFLFAAINGEGLEDFRPSVRERIKPQASLNELPANMSEVTAFCYEQDNESYHLHGEFVLTASDIKNLQKHLWEENEYDQKIKWDLEGTFFHTYINDNTIAAHQGWDDVRIIGWYDN